MFRSIAKTCLASAYTLAGGGRWFAQSDPTCIPFIAGYHRVVRNFSESARHAIPSLLISSETFERHLEWLGRRFQFVSLDEIGEHLRNGRRFSRPAAAITFDDGYADVYHNAFPILKRKGIPAAVFVVTELIGGDRRQIYDRLYMCLARENPPVDALSIMTSMLTQMPQREILKMIEVIESRLTFDRDAVEDMAPLSWEMLQEMQSNDITIGSHTKSHVLLTSEAASEASRQLIESKQMLEERLKRPIHHFAYPDGRCNPAIVTAVKSAGYRYGYTICRWRDPQAPLFTIPRKILWEKASMNVLGRFSSSIMNCHTDWAFDSRECEHDHGVAAA